MKTSDVSRSTIPKSITSRKRFFTSAKIAASTMATAPASSIGKYIFHISARSKPCWTKISGIRKNVDDRPAPQTKPPQLIVRKAGTFQTIFAIFQKETFCGSSFIVSGFGTVVSTKTKLANERTAIIKNIPFNPSHSPKNGAAPKARAKAIPTLAPNAAFARVRTSGRVKSAIKANTVELIAPVP